MFAKTIKVAATAWIGVGFMGVLFLIHRLLFVIVPYVKPVYDDNSQFSWPDEAWNWRSFEQSLPVWGFAIIITAIFAGCCAIAHALLTEIMQKKVPQKKK